jgi:hypothetical protein
MMISELTTGWTYSLTAVLPQLLLMARTHEIRTELRRLPWTEFERNGGVWDPDAHIPQPGDDDYEPEPPDTEEER